MKEPSTALAFVLLILAGPIGAQETPSSGEGTDEPEMVTDRPDQTESTAIVPIGRTQIELGVGLAQEDVDGFDLEISGGPATLVRIGLTDSIELRLGWEGWIEEEIDFGPESVSADGFGDAEVGTKIGLREGDGVSPAVAVIVATSVPVGEEGFSSERFDPSARLTVSHDFASGVGLGWNIGIESGSEPSDDGGRTTLTTAIYTLAAGFPASDRWGVFVEAFGDVPLSAEGDPAHLLDAGVTWLVRPSLQLDAAAGAGISDAAPDWFAAVGLSVRLPR